MTTPELVVRYEQTYSGRKLLGEHNLYEEGTWQVYGEDPNCDLGGPHHEPNLGLLEGKLRDVIEVAVNLPGFWAWGGGGRIVKYAAPVVRKVDSNTMAKRAAAEKRITELEAELKRLKEQL